MAGPGLQRQVRLRDGLGRRRRFPARGNSGWRGSWPVGRGPRHRARLRAQGGTPARCAHARPGWPPPRRARHAPRPGRTNRRSLPPGSALPGRSPRRHRPAPGSTGWCSATPRPWRRPRPAGRDHGLPRVSRRRPPTGPADRGAPHTARPRRPAAPRIPVSAPPAKRDLLPRPTPRPPARPPPAQRRGQDRLRCRAAAAPRSGGPPRRCGPEPGHTGRGTTSPGLWLPPRGTPGLPRAGSGPRASPRPAL